jgi:hypothetical protein
MTPYKCPACDGFGKRVRKEGGKKKRCKACHGTCVVWSQGYNYPWTYTTPYITDHGSISTDTVTLDPSGTAWGGDGMHYTDTTTVS